MAVTVQSAFRGHMVRRALNEGLRVVGMRKFTDAEREERLRVQMAAFLYPSRGEEVRAASLAALEAELAKKGRKLAPRATGLSQELSAAAAAAAEKSAEKTTAEEEAATKMQARARGLLSRAKARADELQADVVADVDELRKASKGDAPQRKKAARPLLRLLGLGALVVGVAAACLALTLMGLMYLPPLGLQISWTLVSVSSSLVLKIAYWAVGLLVCLFCWLRSPHWLGALATHLVTWLPLHGFPLGFETARIYPWISYGPPLALHLDLNATCARTDRTETTTPSPPLCPPHHTTPHHTTPHHTTYLSLNVEHRCAHHCLSSAHLTFALRVQ
jgi:multisubunit Na+/H+ antiporter MnhC subunit